MRRLVMWDIDYTLLRGGGLALRAWRAAFTEVTGVAWRADPSFGGRTDLDICAEVFETHGVADREPGPFFAAYIQRVLTAAHLFAEQGELMPGVRDVLDRLGKEPDVVQTLVTGNVPEVAAAKVAAFGLSGAFDAEVGGYGSDDRVRSILVRRSLERAEAKYGEPFTPIVVGDTVHDVSAGLANNALVVGVATGRTSMAELALAGAHAVLPDLADVDTTLRVLTP